MRRAASVALQQLASRAPGASTAAGSSQLAACSLPQLLGAVAQPAGAAPSGVRGFAAGGEPPKIVETPLRKIVPPIMKAAGMAVRGVQDGLGAAANGLAAASGPAITYFADNMLLSGSFLDMKDIDVAKWAHWLAGSGYTTRSGWDQIVAWGRDNAASLSAAQASALIDALYTVDRYDKELFTALAGVIQDKYMDFETEAMCRIAAAYAENDHFEVSLFDDIADSIAYCNHYFAPDMISLKDITACLAAYAKYGHDRADLFTTLARTVHEDRLKKLSDEELRATVMGLLRAFNKLEFWPDCTEALLVAAQLKPGAFGADAAEIASITTKLEGYAGGKLPWLDGGYLDWEHFHGKPFGDYNLYVLRGELDAQYYKPSDYKVWKEGA